MTWYWIVLIVIGYIIGWAAFDAIMEIKGCEKVGPLWPMILTLLPIVLILRFVEILCDNLKDYLKKILEK